jgi:hypothetical protein
MPTKLMMVFLGVDFIFAACGGLILGFSLISEKGLNATPTVQNVTKNILLDQCPLSGTAPILSKCFNIRRCAIVVTRALAHQTNLG